MRSTVKGMLAVILIFGATISYGQNKKMRHDNREQKTNEYLEKLKTDLELTEEQENQMRDVYRERNDKLKSQRSSNDELADMDDETRKQAKMEQLKMRQQFDDEMDVRVAEILNEEQMAKYKAMSQQRRLEMKARHQDQKMDGEQQHRKTQEGDTHMHEDGSEH